MKQGSNSRRPRGRGNGKRQPKNQNFDSNGPDGRVRGNASQIHEKYLAMARDAQSAGDPVASENYSQHAEHFFRVMAARAESNEKKAEGRNEGRNERGNNRGDQRGDQRGRNNQRGQRSNSNRENAASETETNVEVKEDVKEDVKESRAENLSPASIVEELNKEQATEPEAKVESEETADSAQETVETAELDDGQEQASA